MANKKKWITSEVKFVLGLSLFILVVISFCIIFVRVYGNTIEFYEEPYNQVCLDKGYTELTDYKKGKRFSVFRVLKIECDDSCIMEIEEIDEFNKWGELKATGRYEVRKVLGGCK